MMHAELELLYYNQQAIKHIPAVEPEAFRVRFVIAQVFLWELRLIEHHARSLLEYS